MPKCGHYINIMIELFIRKYGLYRFHPFDQYIGIKAGKALTLAGSDSIEMATGVSLGNYVVFDARSFGIGKITIGADSEIHDYCQLKCFGGSIKIGEKSSVNPFCILYGHGGLTIGNNSRIATHCVMIPANHSFDRLDIPIARQEETRKGIVIGDDVWIGANSVILDGVTIGNGAVIGAGSVVSRDIAPCAVGVGVPAKVIKTR